MIFSSLKLNFYYFLKCTQLMPSLARNQLDSASALLTCMYLPPTDSLLLPVVSTNHLFGYLPSRGSHVFCLHTLPFFFSVVCGSSLCSTRTKSIDPVLRDSIMDVGVMMDFAVSEGFFQICLLGWQRFPFQKLSVQILRSLHTFPFVYRQQCNCCKLGFIYISFRNRV